MTPETPAMGRLHGVAVPALVFVAVWAFRFLSMGALENDHFVHLALAHQTLQGNWPIRDFADPGMLLAYLASAAAAKVIAPTLLADVVLTLTLLSAAAALTWRLAYRATGSLLLAGAAVGAGLVAGPRLYSAGKLLFPLAALALAWHYADRPSRGRLTALAAWTAVATLWRHDLGVYIALATLPLLLLCHERATAIRRVCVYAALCGAFLLPWLTYVQWAVGVDAYLASVLRFVASEASRTAVALVGAQRLGVLVFMGLPLIALALARRAAPDRLAFPHVAYAAVLALSANLVLLRDVIATRAPDVMSLTAVIAVWIAARVIPPRLVRAGAGLALVLACALVGWRLWSQGYGLPGPGAVARRFAAVATWLHTAAPEVVPNHERGALIRYIATCTPPHARVLVSGFGPEIPVLAGRPYAAGLPVWLPGYYRNPGDVERAARQLAREQVSMAVMLEGSASFVEEWPRLADDLRARGFVERTWPLDRGEVVVWVPADAPQAPRC